jgi:putative transposase
MPKGKRISAQFKFKVALEAAKGTRTINEIASEFGIHPSQISEWKARLLSEGDSIFNSATAQEKREQANLETDLYEQIGRLKVELDWLKKKVTT